MSKAQTKAALKASAAATPHVSASGEVSLDLGARRIRLKVSLGALAKIEDHFEVESFEDALDEMRGTKGLAQFIAFLAEAAGETVTVEEIRHSEATITDLRAAIGAAIGQASEPDQGNAPAPGR